ncbi:MAG: kelch repeat-containing protein, partial [Bacteroidota bacterium]|nr:kelch repeat-containing protein [Bacteroidota bacterium]
IIDIQSGQVSYNTSNPYPVEYGGSAVWNNKIYVFGGYNSEGFSNRLYEYDPVTNIWARLPDMPEAKQTNGEIVNGILYVIGGYNGSSSARVDAYEIQNSSWLTLEELPAGISAHSMTTSGNNIWIIGSYNNIHMVAIYNTETNEFTQLNSNMIGRRHCGVCIEGTDLYIYGGNQNTGSILKSLQSANISSYIHSIDEYVDHQMIIITNFPNPFTTTTTLSYTIDKTSNVIIQIFSSQGQLIKKIEQEQPKGQQQMQWNAEGLPAGLYITRLQAGNNIAFSKLLFAP